MPRTINLDMPGYIADANSIVYVAIDGALLPPDPTYYTINGNHSVVYLTDRGDPEANTAHVISIRVLQSKIGNPPDLSFNTMTTVQSTRDIAETIPTSVTITA